MKALHKEKKERIIPKQQRKQEFERIYIFDELQVFIFKIFNMSIFSVNI